MKRLPGEKNWYIDVLRTSTIYGIDIDEDRLKSISKELFKTTVKSSIRQFAFDDLTTQCASQSKTGDLKYSSFQTQPYLSKLYPSQGKTILKCRAKCLKIKTHRPFQFPNKVCRWCNLEDESLAHIVNCGWEEKMDLTNIQDLMDIDIEKEAKLVSLATRVNHFLELVDF